MIGDFGHCHVGTLHFYLKKRKPIIEIYPGGRQVVTEGGMLLVFTCVRMDATGPDQFARAFPGLSLS